MVSEKQIAIWGFLTAVALVAGILGLSAVLAVTAAYFEAKAYNRVTGSNVTTWDAIWLDLRVQREPSPENVIR